MDMSLSFSIIILFVSPNESFCPTLIQQTLNYCVGCHYFTLETFCFQLRFAFPGWIWDPGIVDFDFTNGGMEFWHDISNFRVEETTFNPGGVHGKDVEVCFLLATQNHHEWSTLNVMAWRLQKAKKESQTENFEYVDVGPHHVASSCYYFAKWAILIWRGVKYDIKECYSVFLLLIKNHKMLKNHYLKRNEEFLIHLSDEDMLKIWLYWVQSKRISMPWMVTIKHVISCSGSVWDGLRCNRWIASNDLLREKMHLLTRIESHKQDLTRPRTKWRKASESACSTNALGSIVLLLSLLKVFINSMFCIIYDSCNMLH
ncbi:unnamed protein product [Brassica rapa subsp. trilocularis]